MQNIPGDRVDFRDWFSQHAPKGILVGGLVSVAIAAIIGGAILISSSESLTFYFRGVKKMSINPYSPAVHGQIQGEDKGQVERLIESLKEVDQADCVLVNSLLQKAEEENLFSKENICALTDEQFDQLHEAVNKVAFGESPVFCARLVLEKMLLDRNGALVPQELSDKILITGITPYAKELAADPNSPLKGHLVQMSLLAMREAIDHLPLEGSTPSRELCILASAIAEAARSRADGAEILQYLTEKLLSNPAQQEHWMRQYVAANLVLPPIAGGIGFVAKRQEAAAGAAPFVPEIDFSKMNENDVKNIANSNHFNDEEKSFLIAQCLNGSKGHSIQILNGCSDNLIKRVAPLLTKVKLNECSERLQTLITKNWEPTKICTLEINKARIKTLPDLPNCLEVDISDCEELIMIGELNNAKKVNLLECSSVEALPDLPSCTELRVTYCDQLKKIGKLSSVQQVNLTNCDGINALPDLPCCTFLLVTWLNSDIAFGQLPVLERIVLKNCSAMTALPDLPLCTRVDFTDCAALCRFGKMDSVTSVAISGCGAIRELPDLPLCHSLTVKQCNALETIGRLPLAEQVTLTACSVLQTLGQPFSEGCRYTVTHCPQFTVALPPPPLESIVIDLDMVEKNPRELLAQLAPNLAVGELPRITFTRGGEAALGLDAGGLRRDFVSRIVHALFAEEAIDHLTWFSEGKPKLNPEEAITYQRLGRLLALCYPEPSAASNDDTKRMGYKIGRTFDSSVYSILQAYATPKEAQNDLWRVHNYLVATGVPFSFIPTILAIVDSKQPFPLPPEKKVDEEPPADEDAALQQMLDREQAAAQRESWFRACEALYFLLEGDVSEFHHDEAGQAGYVKYFREGFKTVEGGSGREALLPALAQEAASAPHPTLGAVENMAMGFYAMVRRRYASEPRPATGAELTERIEGKATAEAIIGHLQWESSFTVSEERKEKTQGFMESWLRQADDETRYWYLVAVTGSGGINPARPITISLYSRGEGEYPSSHTCFNSMELTADYSTQAMFDEKIGQLIASAKKASFDKV